MEETLALNVTATTAADGGTGDSDNIDACGSRYRPGVVPNHYTGSAAPPGRSQLRRASWF